jgi:hypothetical protein
MAHWVFIQQLSWEKKMREITFDEIDDVSGGESTVIVAGEVIGAVATVTVAAFLAPVGLAAGFAYATAAYATGYGIGWGINWLTS